MSALFVRDQNGAQWVNLARATAIKVLPDDRAEGQWIVLAVFAGRSTVIGRKDTQADAEHLAAQLAARTNAGGSFQ